MSRSPGLTASETDATAPAMQAVMRMCTDGVVAQEYIPICARYP